MMMLSTTQAMVRQHQIAGLLDDPSRARRSARLWEQHSGTCPPTGGAGSPRFMRRVKSASSTQAGRCSGQSAVLHSALQ